MTGWETGTEHTKRRQVQNLECSYIFQLFSFAFLLRKWGVIGATIFATIFAYR